MLPPDAREAILSCDTAAETDVFVRSFIGHRILTIGSCLAVPALVVSLSRALVGPWTPVLTAHAVIAGLLWLVSIFRERLPDVLVFAAFPAAAFGYAVVETVFHGLATGSPVIAMFVPILTVPVFGFRKAMAVFAGVAVIFATLAVEAISRMNALGGGAHAVGGVDALTMIVAGVAALILCTLSLVAFGTLMSALRLRQVTFETLAGRVARDKERFDLAMEGSNDGLWDWNLETGEVYRSDRWYRQLGLDPGDAAHDVTAFIERVHPADIDRLPTSSPDKVAAAGPKIETKIRLRHADGFWVPILSRAFVVTKDGKPVRVVGTINGK